MNSPNDVAIAQIQFAFQHACAVSYVFLIENRLIIPAKLYKTSPLN